MGVSSLFPFDEFGELSLPAIGNLVQEMLGKAVENFWMNREVFSHSLRHFETILTSFFPPQSTFDEAITSSLCLYSTINRFVVDAAEADQFIWNSNKQRDQLSAAHCDDFFVFVCDYAWRCVRRAIVLVVGVLNSPSFLPNWSDPARVGGNDVDRHSPVMQGVLFNLAALLHEKSDLTGGDNVTKFAQSKQKTSPSAAYCLIYIEELHTRRVQ
ncbi:hypothetical protein BLNAU_19406 [Blattamonas nauphoetae]|uniref:Uncharacterized protein n=1 Tax=Blattamonas nauphoetae TaxID=2049346 RepID=A0ABQ9X410_9EUKA|nr:hypothetical protein BLNAU_19406 [Blattamonas nauphoetae]